MIADSPGRRPDLSVPGSVTRVTDCHRQIFLRVSGGGTVSPGSGRDGRQETVGILPEQGWFVTETATEQDCLVTGTSEYQDLAGDRVITTSRLVGDGDITTSGLAGDRDITSRMAGDRDITTSRLAGDIVIGSSTEQEWLVTRLE